MDQVKDLKINRFKRDHCVTTNQRKYYKIFILTKDDYYFIIEKRRLYKSLFFKNIFDLDKTSGNITNPIFLKKFNSKNIKIIIEYLNYYYNKIDFFEIPNTISYNNINYFLTNIFDKNFFKKFNTFSIQELEKLMRDLSYFNIISLNKKMKLFLYFKKNQKLI